MYGTNVGQAYQYAQAGAAQAAFVSLSLALSERGKTGCFLAVPESPAVEQKACVLTFSAHTKAAEQFLQYATSGETAAFLEKNFGYE